MDDGAEQATQKVIKTVQALPHLPIGAFLRWCFALWLNQAQRIRQSSDNETLLAGQRGRWSGI